MFRLDIPSRLIEVESEGFTQLLVLKLEVREWLNAHAGINGTDWIWSLKSSRDFLFMIGDQEPHLSSTEILFDSLETSLLFKLTWGGV